MTRAGDDGERLRAMRTKRERRFEPDDDAAGVAGIVGVPPACGGEWRQ
jgi:hypothetical protein